MNRRDFIHAVSLAPVLVAGCQRATPSLGIAPIGPVSNGVERRADLIIIGAGLGGCAAALAALRRDHSVILTEPTDWIGGQLTSQAVPPDEHKWIETIGCTRSYRRLREAIRDVYRMDASRPLIATAKARKELNPGNGWVSRLCHEPRVALNVLEAMFAPYVANGKLVILRNWQPDGCDLAIDRIRAINGRDSLSGDRSVLIGEYYLDASEQGDLLPLAKAEFVTGCESRKKTCEARAPIEAQPSNIQSFSVCFAMEYRPGEDHTIDKPADYETWKTYTPKWSQAVGETLFSWNHPSAAGKRFGFNPTAYRTPEGPNLWTYRRIVDAAQFQRGAISGDVSIINWHHNDYTLGALHAVRDDDAANNLEAARQLSLSLAYWLQTAAPRTDGGTGWKGLKLSGDILGTKDGLAKAPYIRESRRIQAVFTVLEQHIRKDMRKPDAVTGQVQAEVFADTVGIGHYPIDLHPSTGGTPGSYVESCPFQIPLGALIPIRLENLLAAGKNLGVTHLTNGAYRLHPTEWNIGEAAGALAVHCLHTKTVPRQIHRDVTLLDAFQATLRQQGFELDWPPEARFSMPTANGR